MELYEKVFGKYLDGAIKQGNNLLIKCLWHSPDNKPSLSISIDPNKPVYKCWSCGKVGSMLGAYMELNNVDYKTALKELDMYDENKAHYKPPIWQDLHPKREVKKVKPELDYQEFCNKAIDNYFNNYETLGKKLYDLRGITLPTAIACQIGYDDSLGWIFPIYRYPDFKCVGYEVRQKEFKLFSNGSKCYKANGSPSCLSIVYRAFNNKRAICMEGFADSYKMYQYLHEKAQKEQRSEHAQVQDTILTPTMGVKTVPELIQSLELWNDFDEILFVLDNDEPSRKITDELKKIKQVADNKGNNFKFFNGLKEGQDWENFYDNLMKGKK